MPSSRELLRRGHLFACCSRTWKACWRRAGRGYTWEIGCARNSRELTCNTGLSILQEPKKYRAAVLIALAPDLILRRITLREDTVHSCCCPRESIKRSPLIVIVDKMFTFDPRCGASGKPSGMRDSLSVCRRTHMPQSHMPQSLDKLIGE